jgi:hypothetical protein
MSKKIRARKRKIKIKKIRNTSQSSVNLASLTLSTIEIFPLQIPP